jgi:hypothetical protein
MITEATSRGLLEIIRVRRTGELPLPDPPKVRQVHHLPFLLIVPNGIALTLWRLCHWEMSDALPSA